MDLLQTLTPSALRGIKARHAIGVNISESPPQYVPATYFAMAPPREFTSSFW